MSSMLYMYSVHLMLLIIYMYYGYMNDDINLVVFVQGGMDGRADREDRMDTSQQIKGLKVLALTSTHLSLF